MSSSDNHVVIASIARTPVGKTAKLTVLRGAKKLTLSAVVAERKGNVAMGQAPSTGELGLSVQDLTDALAQRFNVEPKSGVLVASVHLGSPASKAGIARGDIIKEIDGKAIHSTDDYRAAIRKGNLDKGYLMLVQQPGDGSRYVVVKKLQ